MYTRADKFVIGAIAVACLWHWGGDYWHSKWTVVMGLFAIVCGMNIARITSSKMAGALFAWFSLSTLYVTMFDGSFYRHGIVDYLVEMGFRRSDLHETIVYRGFESNAWQAGAAVWLGVFSVMSITSWGMIFAIEKTVAYAALLNSFLICIQFLRFCTTYSAEQFPWLAQFFVKMDPGNAGGMFDQGSLDGIFIAVCYPLLLGSKSFFRFGSRAYFIDAFISCFVPIIACIILCFQAKASQPILLISGAIGLDLIRIPWALPWGGKSHSPTFTQKFLLAVIAVLVAVLIGSRTNVSFFSSSGRTEFYSIAWELMTQMQSFVWGLGTGTWPAWTYYVQHAKGVVEFGYMSWLHSDWLQVLIEQGAVGFVFLAGVGTQAYARAYKNCPRFSTALATYGASMIFNFPMHLAVHAFLGLFLLRVCLTKED